MSAVLVSKDAPEVQRNFANFRLASYGAGDYLQDQASSDNYDNMPGALAFERKSDVIFRKNCSTLGPGDLSGSMWGLLVLAGLSEEEWTPQFNYWRRPKEPVMVVGIFGNRSVGSDETKFAC